MASPKKQVQTPSASNKKSLYFVVSAIAIIVSLFYSYHLKWLGDDIFIALRYVQNFLDGYGLVYNPGEHVEGYTDFLWLMLISLFAKLHFDPLNVTQFLGILFSLGTLVISAVIGKKIADQKGMFILPFMTIAMALNYDYNVWATSGLETSFYAFLLCSAFYVFFFSAYPDNKRFVLSGLFLALAMMTRPDALLITFGANVLMILHRLMSKTGIKNIFISLLYFNAALVFVYLPYFLWRYNYYGFIFPNTYYVKLGNETLFSKGFYYIWLYFKPHFTSFLIIVFPPLLLFPLLKGKILQQLNDYLSDKRNAAYLAAVIFVFAYLILFVAKVGGDFMHARFIMPVVPFIYFIIYYSMVNYISAKNINIALTVLILCSFVETNIRGEVFKAPDKDGKIITTLNQDVADERYVYTEYLPIEKEIKLGKILHNTFQGIDAKMLVRGGQGCVAYFADFNYAQEYHGLTDTLIAHSKVEHRGRIGHEKHATNEYLQNKGIHFLFNRSPITKDQYKYAALQIPPYNIRVEIITFNNKIIDQLRQRMGENFKYTDFRAYLDEYIAKKLPVISKDELKKDYNDFYLYYFKHNDDKARENLFLEKLK